MAYASLSDAPDWKKIKQENGYRGMHKAETANGTRLLDVLDLHYYTEAKGACGERSCNHYDNDECIKARPDSVCSLYESDYRENSCIMDTGAEFFPLLPNVLQSIDKYYPDTKLAFTEYNFGGGDHISGGVCEADMLGIFAEYADSPLVRRLDVVGEIIENSFTYTLLALSVTEFVVNVKQPELRYSPTVLSKVLQTAIRLAAERMCFRMR